MAKFLLRDGNKISANITPSTFETYSYRDKQGNEINALLSVRTERQLLKMILISTLPMQARMQLAMNRISA